MFRRTSRRSVLHVLSALAAAPLAAAVLVACGTPPNDLDRSLQHASREGRFAVRLEPPEGGAPLQRLHSWQVHLSTPDGRPVRGAQLLVDGGMPQHGHGLPTRPRVTRETAPGVYLVEGLKFSMGGWWDLRLDIRAGDQHDQATFNLVLGPDGLQR